VNSSNSGYGTHEFTGDERDAESGLDHTWFRQYSSSLGRWMHPDPAGLAAVDIGNPQSWNRYAYVINNPLNLVDPSGLVCSGTNGLGDTPCNPGNSGGGGGSGSFAGYGPFGLMSIPVVAYLGAFYVNVGPGVINGYPDGYEGEAAIFQVVGSGFDLFGGIGGISPTAAGSMCSSSPALLKPASDANYRTQFNAKMEFTPPVADALSSAIRAMNGVGIVPTFNDGYRTASDQAQRVAGGSGPLPAAAVGWSPHQAGQAVDINGTWLRQFSTIQTIMGAFGFSQLPNREDPPHFQMTSGDRATQISLAANYRAVCSVGRTP